MNVQATIDQLEKMKLHGMAGVYKTVSESLTHQQPDLNQFMARLAEAEWQDRQQKKTIMYLKTSKLRYHSSLEEITCTPERNLSKEALLKVADCSFVKRAENILITGKTGTGKSYLACALGRQACHLGIRTIYLGMNKFIEKVSMAKIDGTFIKLINQIEKNSLIILDDFGIQPLDANTRLALLQILEDCYQRKAVIVTSQLPIAKWYDYVGEPTLADAIMDRLMANAHRIELKGPSLRVRNTKK